jgi:lipocalin
MGPNKSAETFWLLSRTPIIDPSVQSITDEFIATYFDRAQMKTVNHTSEK